VVGLPDALARLQACVLEHMPGGPLMSRDNLDSMKADNVASGRYPLPPHWKPTPLESVAPDYLRR
jgi:NADH dehydrogenase